jgi:methylmalonyl-CoA mutase cobalamin-binding subunit
MKELGVDAVFMPGTPRTQILAAIAECIDMKEGRQG